MILKRCKKGHYYDGDKYQKCPHCLEEDHSPQQAARHVLKKSVSLKDSAAVAKSGSLLSDDLPTMPLASLYNDSVTIPLASLSDDLNERSTSFLQDDPVTMPLSSLKNHSEGMQLNAKTSAIIDPVAALSQERRLTVGWLVCIKGKDFGIGFAVKDGINYIGCSAEMDIALHKDNREVKEKHAVIYYVPKQKKFIAEPGKTRDLFYLNGEVVLNPVEIKKQDVLTIGNTSLMFVPFCGEDFNWEDAEKNMRGGLL